MDAPENVPGFMKKRWLETFAAASDKAKADGDDPKTCEAKGMAAANEILKKKAEMADFNTEWVEIFRAGDYGDKGVWTESQLDQVVSNFSTWKPPAVLGHPETNSPAMGWVSALQRQGKTLVAKFDQVQPELEQLVTGGRFPNRSAAFYTDPQGNGPVLRHVGFLGATPPEVKGLAPIKFSSSEFTEINFEEEVTMDKDETKKTIKEEIKAFFSELFGGKPPVTSTFSEEQVQARIAESQKPLMDKLTALTTQFTELSQKLTASSANTVKARVLTDIAHLKATNKWVPAYDAQGMAAFMEAAALSGTELTFGETGKETKCSSYDALLKFLESQKPIVPVNGLTTDAKTGKVYKFNETSKGVQIDMQSVALSERADKISAEKKITFNEALPLAVQEMSV